ncbi:MAG: UDP-glucose 4-epimerase GalE [Planctomycetaceae bacterium]|jgi:UDP-glucose 4-epimerase|nr:UDP-glucose 4-epimerase GalE [Planctomycetaceae bacterium]
MNILVTGGAGYIGSHAVKLLLRAGHRVVVLDNLCTGHRESVPPEVPFYQNSLTDREKITAVLREHKTEGVMHFAAFIEVGESVREPLKYFQNNTAGAVGLLLAMKEAGVKKLVFSSTAATYGEPDETPIVETSRQAPINPYGRSKWFVEWILRDTVKSDPEFSFTALRYFNVAGAAKDGTIGEAHHPESHLIPNILYAAMGKKEKICVFGTDYPTPDGTCIRDYVYIEDLISAHILAMAAQKPGEANFYNLGIGHGYSVREMLDAAEKVTKSSIPIEYGERRAGDPAVLYASSGKIQQELGWKPQVTDIEEIIATAWNWHSRHPNGYAV